jgi:replicative DNA helicase
MSCKEQIKYMEGIEEFINHNMNVGYIKPTMTVDELLRFIKNVKENYIPMIQKMEDLNKLSYTTDELNSKSLEELQELYFNITGYYPQGVMYSLEKNKLCDYVISKEDLIKFILQ